MVNWTTTIALFAIVVGCLLLDPYLGASTLPVLTW
jgi:hypothetical protein